MIEKENNLKDRELLQAYFRIPEDEPDDYGLTRKTWDRINPEIGMPQISVSTNNNLTTITFPKLGESYTTTQDIEKRGNTLVKIDEVSYLVPIALIERYNPSYRPKAK